MPAPYSRAVSDPAYANTVSQKLDCGWFFLFLRPVVVVTLTIRCLDDELIAEAGWFGKIAQKFRVLDAEAVGRYVAQVDLSMVIHDGNGLVR